jgi:hypothetical protein
MSVRLDAASAATAGGTGILSVGQRV